MGVIKMSLSSYHSLRSSEQKTYEWLKEIQEHLRWEDKHRVYIATRAVLHTVRDRLPVREAIQLGAQLPMLMRGFYFQNYNPNGKPEHTNSEKEFYDKVQQNSQNLHINAEEVTEAVLTVLQSHVSLGEIEDIVSNFPKRMRDMWGPVPMTFDAA